MTTIDATPTADICGHLESTAQGDQLGTTVHAHTHVHALDARLSTLPSPIFSILRATYFDGPGGATLLAHPTD